MLLVNGERLENLDGRSIMRKTYNTAISKLKNKFGTTIVLDFPNSKKMMVDTDMGTKIEQTPMGVIFKPKSIYQKNFDQTEVVYYESFTNDKFGNKIYTPEYFDFNGKMALDLRTKADLAFYLIFISPFCGSLIDDDLRSLQNDRRSINVEYVVFDENGVAEREMNINSRVAEAQAMISSATMGLHDDMIKKISTVYGLISPAEGGKLSSALMRKRLGEYVLSRGMQGYDVHRIEQFLEDSKMDHIIKIRALIKEATDKDIIQIKRSGVKQEYCVCDNDGKVVSTLCTLKPLEDASAGLLNYLSDDEEAVTALENLVIKRRK